MQYSFVLLSLKMSSSNNPFYDPDEEVDDEEFLRGARNGRPGYMLPQNNSGGASSGPTPEQVRKAPLLYERGHSLSCNFSNIKGSLCIPSFSQMRQQMLDRKRAIENRTLESSERSLGMIFESEKVGQGTAAELARQKEQLKATEARLDGINSNLKQSERHLTGIKSVFGGIRNYFSGRGAAAPAAGTGATAGANAAASSAGASSRPGLDFGDSDASSAGASSSRLDDMRRDNHPGLRGAAAPGAGLSVDDRLDKNLVHICFNSMKHSKPASNDSVCKLNLFIQFPQEEMSLGLSRLKGLATGLNQELEEHNELIDRLDDKTSSTHWRVEKQNKDIGKLLKK